MDQLYSFDGKAPVVHPQAFIHPTACIIGDVHVGEACFVGPHATLRGDHGPIRLQRMSNVQDNCVVHALPGGSVILSPLAQVGHGAVLHGCTLLEGSLAGIHATVLDGAVVGAYTLVGAHSLVVAGEHLQGEALYTGTPARLVRRLSPSAVEALRRSGLAYAETARRYPDALRRVARRDCLAGVGTPDREPVAASP